MFKEFFKYKLKFTKERNLLLKLNNELRKLKYSVNNRKKIILESRQILLIINQLEKADIYWFIKEDIKKIKRYIKKLRKNPKNKGLVYFLTSVYIVAPFTFEATGVIMFFRYMWRYFFKKEWLYSFSKCKPAFFASKQLSPRFICYKMFLNTIIFTLGFFFTVWAKFRNFIANF